MNALKKTLGMATIAALLATSTTPAMARPGHGWGGGGYGWNGGGHGGYGGYGRHRGWGRGHHDGDGFGNFLLGAIVAGGIIAIASSASKKAKDERTAGDRPRGSSESSDKSAWTDAQNDAANACAEGVEDEASRRGIKDRVDDIDYVDRDGTDGYRVEGRLEGGKAFACGVKQSGELSWVQLADAEVAWR